MHYQRRRSEHSVPTIAIASLLASMNVLAQMTPPSMLNCPQLALAEQARPSAGSALVEPSTRADERAMADAGCWIDLDRATAREQPEPTWIDVRPAPAIAAARIPGALEIPLSALRSKEFLKHAPIVLIGSGRDDGDLLQACRLLKEQGFDQIRLLRGGARAWYDAGKPLVRDAKFAQAIDILGSLELYRAASAPWVIVGVDVDATIELPRTAIPSRRIDVSGDWKRAVAMIGRIQLDLARASDTEKTNAIVVIARDAHASAELSDVIRNAGLHNVLTLEGGVSGYRAFLEQQHSIAANSGKSLMRPCGSG